MRTKIALVLILCLVLAAAAGMYARTELRSPYPAAVGVPVLVEIPAGIGTRAVLGILEDRNVIRSRHLALAYLVYTGQRASLQAGEYMFERPLTIPEVVSKLAGGRVFLRKFTVPEGLTVAETAREWERQKFGTAREFESAAAAAVDVVRAFDPEATSAEGYLFPETYFFPSRTTSRQAVEAMVKRFLYVTDELKKSVPEGQWPLKLKDTAILASLVETEAAHESERALVASVYVNRLRLEMLLQCDPTVIYALEQAGKYRGSLLLEDLKFDSPYNTYIYPGLPPGPIASAGYSSLRAAVQPAATEYLFFVRAAEGKHAFSETLAQHNRAVAAYRAMVRSRPSGTD